MYLGAEFKCAKEEEEEDDRSSEKKPLQITLQNRIFDEWMNEFNLNELTEEVNPLHIYIHNTETLKTTIRTNKTNSFARLRSSSSSSLASASTIDRADFFSSVFVFMIFFHSQIFN